MTMTQLNGKVILVTGGTTGLGKCVCEQAALAGMKVAFNGRNVERGHEVLQSIQDAGGDAIFVQGDVSNKSSVDDFFDQVAEKFGKIDLVYANAGIDPPGSSFLDLTEDDIDKIFNVNFKGALYTIQKAAKVFQEQSGAGGGDGGTIVAASSLFGLAPAPPFTSYSCSKAAVDALVRCAAADLASSDIRVYAINPAAFDTEMIVRASGGNSAAFAESTNPSKTLGNPKNVYDLIIKLYLNEANFKPGSSIVLDNENTMLGFDVQKSIYGSDAE